MKKTISLSIMFVLIGMIWSAGASAQMGTGYPCTSGWPTSYSCEMFSFGNTPSALSTQLWSTSQGYCYLTMLDTGPNGGGTVHVDTSNGNWTLNRNDIGMNGVATCVSFPAIGAPVTGSVNGATHSAVLLTQNTSFCNIAGIQYNRLGNSAVIFRTAGFEYPATASTVDLHMNIQNGSSTYGLFGECMSASGNLWWGNTTFSNRATDQNVFVYGVGSGYNVLPDVSAQNSICAFTQIYPSQNGQLYNELQVDDETGNWATYSLTGSAQVACIAMPVITSRSGWVATGSSGTTNPGNAIDSSLSSRWTTNAGQAPGQYIQIDLGSVRSFNRMVMTSNSDYSRGFNVKVSSDGSSWSSAIYSGAGTSSTVTASFAHQNARYVRLTQTAGYSSKWWSIYDLNVYY